jgi:hypothetical protein
VQRDAAVQRYDDDDDDDDDDDNPWSRIPLEYLTDIQLVKKSFAFREPEGSLVCAAFRRARASFVQFIL